MRKETITYIDYNGNKRTEDFYFNLNKAEIAVMENSISGGLSEIMRRAVEAQDMPSLITIFQDLIHKSYGVKTPDGRGFLKKPEDLEMFKATEAYSELFMKLATDTDAAIAFAKGIMPADMSENTDVTALTK